MDDCVQLIELFQEVFGLICHGKPVELYNVGSEPRFFFA